MIRHLKIHLRRQLRRLMPGKATSLDEVIPAEIQNDDFYRAIQRHASSPRVRTILEIGSSAGEGSTRAFVAGILQNPSAAKLYCMEVSKARFAALQGAYAAHDFVRPFNVSSVPIQGFATPEQVAQFYRAHTTNLNKYPLEMVLGWLRADIQYVTEHGKDDAGIRQIRQIERLDEFDLVLIDGSEFTGKAELNEVIGTPVIMLDDINGFKNYENYFRLKSDPDYYLEMENWSLRNGFAIFVRKDAA